MDIPDTGAIFTLGRSHLAENSQSYFFIKNDPVKRLTSGSSQSAVICESGRLFVWGENQFGQLGITGTNATEIVNKPTCVKSLKALGLRASDVAFGAGWSVILSYSNEIFFAGRNIFTEDTTTFRHFSIAEIDGERFSIARKPFRLEEFDGLLEDNKAEDFQKLSAGNDHFVVLTSSGRLFGWGGNDVNQLGLDDENLLVPVEVTMDGKIKDVTCGPRSTLLLTENNQLFLAGNLNDFHFPIFVELILNIQPEKLTFIYTSRANEIFFITESGNIFKSNESSRNKKLTFQKFYDYDNEENGPAIKLVKGNLFFAALTRKNKFFTTFSESGHHLKTFREISKFKNLRILDVAVGDKHVLAFGIPKTAKHLEASYVLNRTYTATAPLHNGTVAEIQFNENEPIPEERNDIKLENKNEDPNGNVSQTKASTEEILNDNLLIKENNSEILDNNATKRREQTPEKSNNNDVAVSQSNLYTENYEELKNKALDDDQNEIMKISVLEKDEEKDVKLPKDESSTVQGGSRFEVKNNGTRNPGNETDANKFEEDINVSVSVGAEKGLEISAAKLPDEQDEREENIVATNNETAGNESNEKVPNYNEEGEKNEQNLLRNYVNESVAQKIVNEKEKVEIDSDDNKVENVIQSPKNLQELEIKSQIDTVIKQPEPSPEKSRKENLERDSNSRNSTKGERIVNKDLAESKNDDHISKFSILPEVVQELHQEKEEKGGFRKAPVVSASPLLHKSPTATEKSIKFDEKSLKSQKSQERLLRPSTPYPDSKQSTPLTTKKSPRQDGEHPDKSNPNFKDGLDNIPEKSPSSRRASLRYSDRGLKKERVEEIATKLSNQTTELKDKYLDLDDYIKEDENLVVEISTGDDILDKTMMNDIRFINDGVDVTERVVGDLQEEISNIEQKLLGDDPSTDIPKSATKFYKGLTTSELAKTPGGGSQKSKELKLKSPEEDERTTASINSNLSGNPFDGVSDVSENPQDSRDNIVHDVDEQVKVGTGKRVQQFITDIKNKGKEMTCRNHRSVQVEDEPPVYTPVDQNIDQKTSRVCIIL